MVHNARRHHDKAAEPPFDLSARMRHLAQLTVRALRSVPCPAMMGLDAFEREIRGFNACWSIPL